VNKEDYPHGIEEAIVKRLDGIKLKKPDMIRGAIGVDRYSKFDDWPPGTLMRGEEALKAEKSALKVLDEYRYAMNDLAVNVLGDVAWASFYLNYDGAIRKRSFDIRSRASMVLTKSGSEWRIVHEHFSMIPEAMPVSAPRAEEKPTTSETQEDGVEEAILKVLEDGSEREIAEITQKVSKILGKEVAASRVKDRCDALLSKEHLKRRGRFYPRYRLTPTP
jgi:hypothetical protein